MKELLMAGVVLLSGCGISIYHEDGELPEVEFEKAEEVCTSDFEVRTRADRVVITCEIKLEDFFGKQKGHH